MGQAPLDIVGQRFGKLVVTSSAGVKQGRTWFNCQCDCGGTTTLRGSSLNSGSTQSCGCLSKKHFIDYTGQTFGHFTFLKYAGKNNYKCHLYEVRCSCGNTGIYEGNDIVSGKIKSCGHLKYEQPPKLPDNLGLYNSIFTDYKWKAKPRGYAFNLSKEQFLILVKARCFYCNTSGSNKKTLGGRTILYNGIDRVDNDRGYEPDNCVTACYRCNQAKHLLTQEAFLDWIKKVAAHQGLLKKEAV